MTHDVSPRLLRAYRQTTYCAGGIAVRIGRRSRGMDVLLRQHSVRQAVFITAWNPFSHRMPDGWNRRMQQGLAERLRRRTVLPASGGAGRWHEDHLLVLGGEAWVVRLACRFRQNAVVAVRLGGAARLHLAGRHACPRRSA
jgi:hypothetical protein